MTNEELSFAMDRIGMTSADLSRIIRRTPRAVENWRSGASPVPGSIAIVIEAMLKGELSISWVIEYANRYEKVAN